MVRRARTRPRGRIIAYLRVSTDDQALGLDVQRAAIEAWAARQPAHVTAWHVDEGVSGGNDLADRPALVEAITALQRGDTLVVHKRDRLARDILVAAQVGRLVEKAGGRIVSADGIGNGDSPAETLMRHMLDAMAQFERQVIAARTKAALAAKAARGERTGQIPYGKQLAPGGELVEDNAAEQATLRRMRELEPGLSCQAVADALAAEGLFNRAGKPFARQAIHELLKGNSV